VPFVVGVEMKASRVTPVCEIAEFMNMDTMFAVRVESFDRKCDFSGRVYVVLAE